MSIYVAAIENRGLMDDEENIANQPDEARESISNFAASFDWVYNLLNSNGRLAPSTIRCAQMIKAVPVPQMLSDPPLMRLVALQNRFEVVLNRSSQQLTGPRTGSSNRSNIGGGDNLSSTRAPSEDATLNAVNTSIYRRLASTFPGLEWGQGQASLSLDLLLQMLDET